MYHSASNNIGLGSFDDDNINQPSKTVQGQSQAIPNKKIEIRDRTTSKFIEKNEGKLTQQSMGPLQGNGMAAI